MQRIIIHYEGHVQGVGFRYTARTVAANFQITGFVRNLADGRVELVAEGNRDELTKLEQAIAERMAAYIRTTSKQEQAATGEFSGFEIRR